MKNALLGTSAAVAIVLGFGLVAWVDAEEPQGPAQAPVEQPAGAQEVRPTVVTPAGRQQQSGTVERQQVSVADGATVTVLRPVMARSATAPRQEEEARRERSPTLQVAAGGRLWVLDPESGDLRTCAMRQTSTVGHKVLRCLSISGAGL